MTDSVRGARAALGQRLHEIRRQAGLTGRELARREGWHESKVSKIEYGRIGPSDSDLRAYCRHTAADDQLPDLLATLHNINAAYMEWRRVLSSGVKRGQEQARKLEADTTAIRNYQSQVVTGLLQTTGYAEAIMRNVIEFYSLPDDLDHGVAKRLERQQILHRRDHKFHFIISETSLYRTVGGDDIMLGQLDRLNGIIGMPRVTFGIVPLTAEARVTVDNFVLFDNRMVIVEGATAELTITQPHEIAIYGRAFTILAEQAATGNEAKTLIRRAAEARA